jgi:hypothetical protein
VLSCRDESPSLPARDARAITPGQPATMLPELRAGSIDFSIGPRPSRTLGEEYNVELRMTNTRAIVCRKNHPLRKSRNLGALIDAERIVSSATGMMATDHDAFFQSHGLDVPQRIIQCDYGTATLALLASTDTLAVQPRQWAEAELTKRVLAQISIEERPAHRGHRARPQTLPTVYARCRSDAEIAPPPYRIRREATRMEGWRPAHPMRPSSANAAQRRVWPPRQRRRPPLRRLGLFDASRRLPASSSRSARTLGLHTIKIVCTKRRIWRDNVTGPSVPVHPTSDWLRLC